LFYVWRWFSYIYIYTLFLEIILVAVIVRLLNFISCVLYFYIDLYICIVRLLYFISGDYNYETHVFEMAVSSFSQQGNQSKRKNMLIGSIHIESEITRLAFTMTDSPSTVVDMSAIVTNSLRLWLDLTTRIQRGLKYYSLSFCFYLCFIEVLIQYIICRVHFHCQLRMTIGRLQKKFHKWFNEWQKMSFPTSYFWLLSGFYSWGYCSATGQSR